MYEFDVNDPSEAKALQSAIERGIDAVKIALTKLQSGPVKSPHEYGWAGAGNSQLYQPIMTGLNLETTKVLKTTQGYGHKTEWLETTNPNVIVLQEYGSVTGDGKNWQMTDRSIGVVNDAWLKDELKSV